MRRAGRSFVLSIVAGSALVLGLLGSGSAWARSSKRPSPGLWIVADRIVGFVPFTVSIYGKVVGSEPGEIEMCRSEVAWITDAPPARLSGDRTTSLDPQQPGDLEGNPCTAGRVIRTPDGYDYTHDMRFDRPGVYQVRLMMVDTGGRRVMSNTVQVNAF